MARRAEILQELAAAAAGPAALLIGLRGALPTLGRGLWGPADPWLNSDFQGGWWLWWAWSRDAAGADPWSAIGWPSGLETVAGVFPNPTDWWLAGHLLGPPSVAAWNGVQLTWLLLNLLAAHAMLRAAGAGRLSAAAAGALLGASPVLLHEVAGGRPSTLVVWPGLLCMALLYRGTGWRAGIAAGLLAAVQGVAYAWYGVALALMALPLLRRGRWRLLGAAVLTGALAVAPYLWWLSRGLSGLPTDRPPAGYTALPLAGLWGMVDVPARYRLHPLLFGASLLGLRGGMRWLIAAWIGLAIAVGPAVSWALGDPLAAGPWAWVSWALAAAARNHHPLRAALLALPALAAALALGLDRMAPRARRLLALGLLASAAWTLGAVDEVTSYDQPIAPPFSELAIPGEGPVIDLLGVRGGCAMGLQTFHGRPIAEPAWGQRPRTGYQGRLERLSRGEPAPPWLWDRLAEAGFTYVLLFDRYGDADPRLEPQLAEDLGPPVAPGIYALP